MKSSSYAMNNNTVKRKRNKEKKDFSVANEDSKEQTTTKDVAADTARDIIDITDTPDVANWNKEIHIKGDAAGIIVNRSHEAKTPQPPTTIDIGLRMKTKKDLIIDPDPADKKEVDEVRRILRMVAKEQAGQG